METEKNNPDPDARELVGSDTEKPDSAYNSAALAAILFSSGTVVAAARLKEFLGWDQKKLDESAESANRILTIIEVAGGYKLVTREELSPLLEKFFTRVRQSGLSKAALEAVSIIAYRQPCTRQEVEEIRGVSCEGVIRWLLDKRLVKVKDRLESPGRPFTYATTDRFMEVFGLKSLKDLPRVVFNAQDKE